MSTKMPFPWVPPATEEEDEARAAEWAPFTPSKVDVRLCYARTWKAGYGGQCQQFPAPDSDLCLRHLKQETEAFLAYGRVDGHIPVAKLREFKRAARMRVWEAKKASGELSAGDGGDAQGLKRSKSSGSFQSDGETAARRKPGRPRTSLHQGPAEGSGTGSSQDARGALPRSSPPSGRGAPRMPPSNSWLSAEGFLLERAPGARVRAWSCEEVWAAALPQEPGPHLQVCIQGAGQDDEPWAHLAAAACKRTAESFRRDGPLSGDGVLEAADWKVSAEALWLLRRGVEQWVSRLLGDLHVLSTHRASLAALPRTCRRDYDFDFQAAQLEEEAAAPLEPTAAELSGEAGEAGGAGRRKLGADARELAVENWQRTLGMRQRFFRVGTADLRAWLRHPGPGPGAPRGRPDAPRLPESARRRFLQAAEAELAAP